MVFNNVLLRAKDPQRITEISGLLSQQASLSSEEPGCERFDVYQSETAVSYTHLTLPTRS